MNNIKSLEIVLSELSDEKKKKVESIAIIRNSSFLFSMKS